MALMIDVDEIAEGDYSSEDGTVMKVNKSEKTDYVELIFVNGTTKMLAKSTEIEMDQGGRFDRPVDPNQKRRWR
jgi:hypothetical protein